MHRAAGTAHFAHAEKPRRSTMMEQALLMVHRHGNEWVQMNRRHELDAADLDPERDWDKDGAVYECPCGDQFIVGPVNTETAYKTIPHG
jgi:hypothetical protein